MACGCGGGGATQENSARNAQEFVVKLPNGRTEIVTGEHAARVLVTQAGGGTFSPR